jgi:polysaccharide pyruvyl transferase WcaK-like protein
MDHVVVSSGDLHNIGDLALLLQCADGIRRRYGSARITARQWARPHQCVLAQLEAHEIGLLDGKDLVGAARAAAGSLVVVGGGQMVRDNASIASLASLAMMMEVARATGGQCAVIGCGVDDLKTRPRRRLWRRMLGKAALATVRDAASLAAAKSLLGERANIQLTADLAFSPSALHDDLKRGVVDDASLVIAPCADASEGRKVDVEDLSDAVAVSARRLRISKVHVVAHDARAQMDPVIARPITEAVRRKAPGVEVSTLFTYDLNSVLRLYRGASLIVTNRLHAIIFGLIAGKPLYVLDDGTAKTRAAAARFAIPIGPAARLGADGVLAGLESERAQGPSGIRLSEFATAQAASQRNFDFPLLAG